MELVRKEKLGNVEVYKTKIFITSLKWSLDSCIILKKNKQNPHIKGKITESNMKVIEFATTVIWIKPWKTSKGFKNFIKLLQKFKNNLTSALSSDTVTLSDVHPIYSVNTKSERKFKPTDLYHLKKFLTISSYYLPIIL